MTIKNGIYIKCASCKKEIYTHPCRIKLYKKRFCSKKCHYKFNTTLTKEKSSHWKGGQTISLGYRRILMPKHPQANNHGYIFEHRFIAEKKIGRLLKRNEIAHHKNGNKLDNRIQNIEVMTIKEHFFFHYPTKKSRQIFARQGAKAMWKNGGRIHTENRYTSHKL